MKKFIAILHLFTLCQLALSQNIVFNHEHSRFEIPNEIIDKISINTNKTEIYMKEINGIKIGGETYDIGSGSSVCYVSPNGSDSNSGDHEHPLLTINTAISAGYTTIILLEGVYTQTINLSLGGNNISIKGEVGKRIIFKKSDNLISDAGTETLVTNYSNVYQLSNVTAISYNNGAKWLFFDGCDDVNTEIPTSEAHPLERGMFYRCDCTRSVHTTATTLSDALTEIEGADEGEYKWFYDATNHVLYFNRPASTSTYPLYKSGGNYISNAGINKSVSLSNIEFRYGVVNISNLNVAKIYNCASKYVYGAGAFVYDNSISVTFVKCEASSCFIGATTGDGFNAHAETGNHINKKCQALFIDCWSHDNNDDGYSDHGYGECTINGGLYEYNGKAGVTPSYGSHCTCYNVMSRHNYGGFLYIGDANDNGNSGQLICYNCISDSNDRGGSKFGFASSAENGVHYVCYNCIAMNEVKGFVNTTGTTMDLIDCKTYNCTTDKQGTINLIKGTMLNN